MTRFQRKVQIKDQRQFGYFRTADAFIDAGYMARLGVAASAVYIAMCRHANDDEEAWPSYQTLADETGLDRRHVIKMVQEVLLPAGVIIQGKSRKTQRYKSNVFVMTNQEDWKPLNSLPILKTTRSDKGVKNPNKRRKAARTTQDSSVSETLSQGVFEKHRSSVSETPLVVFQKHPKETHKKETQEPHTTPTPPREADTTKQRGGVVFAPQEVADPVIAVLAEALETTPQTVKDVITERQTTLAEFCHAASYAVTNKGVNKRQIASPLLWLRNGKAFDAHGAFVHHNGTRHLDLPTLIVWMATLAPADRMQVDAYFQKKFSNYTSQPLSILWMSHEFQARAASLHKQWQQKRSVS